MSRKSGVDTYQQKMSRNDRFAQMSHQEKIIEQKKKEILAKLEAKRSTSSPPDQETKSNTSTAKSPTEDAKNAINIFNNDGSFLNTFKNLKDKRLDSKLKSFNKAKDNNEKNNGDDRSDKSNRWSQSARSMSPKDRSKSRISRFSDKFNNLEPKITINTSFNTFTQQNFDFDLQQNVPVIPQNVTGQPLLKNLISSPEITFSTVSQNDLQVVTAQPLLLNVPPPQLVQDQINNSIVIPSHLSNMLVSSTDSLTVLSTVTLPPNSIISNQITVAPQPANMSLTPPCVPTVELAAIPPPNPIQLQNIPQPEPLNTLTIPQPAPLQVQNIPTPTSLHLNEIPNPKPLDLLAIPTPNEEDFSESGFLKNIPPPNKSIPPPNIPETNITITSHPNNCIPICNLPQQTIAQNLSSAQILVQTLQPLQAGAQMSIQQQHLQSVNNNVANATSMQQNTFAPVISVSLPVGVVPQTSINVSTSIPALMAQPILPPPGMGLTTMPSVNVNCPPPLLSMGASGVHMQNPPPTYMNQPPPMTNQMPPMNVPPPPSSMSHGNQMQPGDNFKDSNAVFPPGTPEYEAMASLARMVAQCGPSIEDVVQQRKTQDPNLWFLFHKESEAYRQYQELVEQFRNEIFEVKEEKFNPDDIYDPDAPIEDDRYDMDYQDGFDNQNGNKRKRKSRWGDKEMNIHPPRIVVNQSGIVLPHMIPMNCQTAGQVMLSRITRTDPALVQYAIQTFGSSNLSEDEWKRAEDHYKINLLYQDMVKKREEVERLNMAGKNKYDYDSDEEIEGGTWEHKLREKEMTATELWAQELTRQAEGKHHIGDFLPPEEFKRFMEKSTAAKEGRQLNFSDYKEFKIKEDNIGFKMLQKLGWTEGEGLGSAGKGIIEPVNKGPSREFNQGLGLTQEELNEDEYESYRKRMMLAYRFRPNPLNNPRRPYY